MFLLERLVFVKMKKFFLKMNVKFTKWTNAKLAHLLIVRLKKLRENIHYNTILQLI
jgi:hypothetical protein